MEKVTILINRLDKLQKSLSPEFRTDATLHDEIISSVLLAQSTSQSINQNTIFTDRKYHNWNEDNKNLSGNLANKSVRKRCWICKKEGCCSDKHPKSVRDEHRRKFFSKLEKGAERYITDIEGKHDDYESDEIDIQALCEEIDQIDENNCQDVDLFLSNAGNITSSVGKEILINLARLSINHLVNTNADDFYPEKSSFISRYSSETFRGILIDSGAATFSTAECFWNHSTY
ncbi:putative glycosyl [Golovinomyces cichoracearum]|uniref:Putative glycosyl n=1 Tax=Golovinomyces cichoracearum TaxID=62708 RepID=A0A420HA98_9PEZI|nr:putative glycosyl [Golovinomyces cichoracearum]